jgi:hypothetical protein
LPISFEAFGDNQLRLGRQERFTSGRLSQPGFSRANDTSLHLGERSGSSILRNNRLQLPIFKISVRSVKKIGYVLPVGLGSSPEVFRCYYRDIDATLIRENLKFTPVQRLRKLEEFVAFIKKLEGAELQS